MNDLEIIVSKLSRDFASLKRFVQGNGTIVGSVAGRIETLEKRSEGFVERLEAVENYPCKNGCLFLDHEKKEDALNDRKRSYRSSDIANWLALAALIFLVIEKLIQ